MRRVIPASTVTVELEDMMVDLVCFDHALAVLRDRRAAGQLRGYVEATLDANPGLAALGVILPRGTVIHLPEFVVEDEQARPMRRLWED